MWLGGWRCYDYVPVENIPQSRLQDLGDPYNLAERDDEYAFTHIGIMVAINSSFLKPLRNISLCLHRLFLAASGFRHCGGISPCIAEMIFSAAISPMRSRVSSVELPRWGQSTTLSRFSSFFSTSGSRS